MAVPNLSGSLCFISFAYILRVLQKSNIHTCQSCSPARVLVPDKITQIKATEEISKFKKNKQ